MKSINLKYVVEDTDRHGNVRIYYRRKGMPKFRLRGPIGSKEFLDDYQLAASGKLATRTKGNAPAGSLSRGSMRELCARYFQSAIFKELDPRTQKVRRGILDRFCQHEGSGEKPFASLMPRHLRTRRDEMADRPEAANSMIKAIRQLYYFAMEYEIHDRNPAADVKYLKGNPDGFHAWTLEEIEQFESIHPVGSKARLALALALYTGQRRSDIVQFGKQHVRDGWLHFTQHKGRNKKPITLAIPILPELQEVIDAAPTGDLTFLVTDFNKPFTSNGFGNRFKKWCVEASVPSNCSVHGLRKSAAARLAERGCTEYEIMAITGHTTSKEVTRYTKSARQRKRAGNAFQRLTGEQK